MEEMDDEARQELGQAVVYRSLGLAVPARAKPPTAHERLLEQAMESDPEVQQRMIDRAIKKEFGDDEEKPPSFQGPVEGAT